jgi:hypothetical protein
MVAALEMKVRLLPMRGTPVVPVGGRAHTHARLGRAGRGAALRSVVLLVIVLLPLLAGRVAPASYGAQEGGIAHDPRDLNLEEGDPRLRHLEAKVHSLVDPGDLARTLYLEWFDRPYARASLAVLVQTLELLRARAGEGPPTASGTEAHEGAVWLDWCESALDRVATWEPSPPSSRSRSPAPTFDDLFIAERRGQWAWIDAGNTGDRDRPRVDPVLAAAMGFRWYGWRVPGRSDSGTLDENVTMLCTALGIAPLRVVTDAGGPELAPVEGVSVLRGVELRTIVVSGQMLRTDRRRAEGISDPSGGEAWAASIARRALARAMTPAGSFALAEWIPPHEPGDGLDPVDRVRLAAWLHTLEGQALTVVSGDWEARRPGDTGSSRERAWNPALIEGLARAGLDLQGTADLTSAFPQPPSVAIVVDPTAVDERDGNRWAPWTAPFWSFLLDRQIRYVVVPVSVVDRPEADSKLADVPSRITLERDDADSVVEWCERIEWRLALQARNSRRVTAREEGGMLAEGIWIRDGRDRDGRSVVAVANLTAALRGVQLRGGSVMRRARDHVRGEVLPDVSLQLPLAPWQIRLLVEEP